MTKKKVWHNPMIISITKQELSRHIKAAARSWDGCTRSVAR